MRVYFKHEFNKTTNYIRSKRYKRENFYQECIRYFIETKVLPQLSKIKMSVDGVKVSNENLDPEELFYLFAYFLYPYHYTESPADNQLLRQKAKSIYNMLYKFN
jgi:hypothetical protein